MSLFNIFTPWEVNRSPNQGFELGIEEISNPFEEFQNDPLFMDFTIESESKSSFLFTDIMSSTPSEPDEFFNAPNTKNLESNKEKDNLNISDNSIIDAKMIKVIPRVKSLPKNRKNTKRETSVVSRDIFAPRSYRKTPKNQPKGGPPESCSEDERFLNVINDPTFTINPTEFGFIPQKFWPNQNFCFGDIVSDFFRRKNNQNCRFIHKLYNALQLTKHLPYLNFFFGVEWVSPKIIKVNKYQFAQLLGIYSIDGSLFHRQGNFVTHGFVELSIEEALEIDKNTDVSGVDLINVKLLTHKPEIFVKGVKEEDINECKWVNSRKQSAVDDESEKSGEE